NPAEPDRRGPAREGRVGGGLRGIRSIAASRLPIVVRAEPPQRAGGTRRIPDRTPSDAENACSLPDATMDAPPPSKTTSQTLRVAAPAVGLPDPPSRTRPDSSPTDSSHPTW